MESLLRMAWARCSTVSANNNGDNGHPCLVPFLILNGSEDSPLAVTLADGLE